MHEKIKMIKAMEFIIRHINNEEYIDRWLTYGVADGDIDYGDLEVNNRDEENLEIYLEIEDFNELTDLFLSICGNAYKDGGLYV